MISVNGVTLDEEAVARELQYHPAADSEEAARQAATALVVRELLVQRAQEVGVACEDDEGFDALLSREVMVPEPSDKEIARYYRRNWIRFRTPPIYEAAHIFFPAAEEDEPTREEAKRKAEAVLRELSADPARFADLARVHSACSSAADGGALGQVSRGDTNPEIEHYLATMEPGTIFAAPVPSRHGYHVLRLDRRDNGREMPLEQVRDLIASYLRESVRRRAVSQYLGLLAAKARIEGLDLAVRGSPLVQ